MAKKAVTEAKSPKTSKLKTKSDEVDKIEAAIKKGDEDVDLIIAAGDDGASGQDLLDSDGKFKDADLQSRYEAYCERKKKEGKDARGPLEWKEASEKWKKLSDQGKEYADEQFREFSQEYEDARPEITIVTNEGTKIRVDAIATDEDGNIIIQEYKSTDDAPFTPNQEQGFPELLRSGGKVVGDGKEGFREGREIPSGTRVQVVRPGGTKYFDEE